jgi:TatD DNase family protein
LNLTDTHTHLYLKEFDADRDVVIKAALGAGVKRFFLPNIDSASIPALFSTCQAYPQHCFPMMGLHPCSVDNRYQDELKVVEYWLGKRRFSAVGEIGIDLYWDRTYINQQKDAFVRQIGLAKRYDLPIVIHSRESFKEVFEIVQALNSPGFKGIFHCFSGTADEARQVVSLGGFKLGIGGVLTFRNAGLDKALEDIDLRYLVLETDSPYLAPVPHRGKRNESAYIRLVAEKLAALKNKTVEEIADITTNNAMEIFG